jgi:hypothetical protein
MINEELTGDLPYLITKNDAVIEASPFFIEFTGYFENEVISSNVSDLFKALRIAPKFDFDNQDIKRDYFLFTKSLDYKNIEINIC